MHEELSPETLVAQAPGDTEPAFRGLVPPIHPATAYERDPDGGYPSGRAYTRADNPTYDHAEQLLAALEAGARILLAVRLQTWPAGQAGAAERAAGVGLALICFVTSSV